MEILICIKSAEFDKYVRPYESYIKPFVEAFHRERHKGSYVGLHPLVQSYSAYLQWPIRKLEYSYVLNQCLTSLEEGGKVLDGGCGVSPLVSFFAQRGCQVYGVDMDEETIALLTIQDSELFDPLVKYCCHSLTNLDFEDESFDIVTCISVLEHLEAGEDTKAVGEMLRVLKKGGRLIVTVDLVPTPSLLVRFKKGFKRIAHFLSKPPFQIARNLSFKKGHPGGPYTIKTAEQRLIDPFTDCLEGDRIQNVTLSPQEVRSFWESHWFEGCLFNENRGYVSLGFVLRKR